MEPTLSDVCARATVEGMTGAASAVITKCLSETVSDEVEPTSASFLLVLSLSWTLCATCREVRSPFDTSRPFALVKLT